MGFVLKNAGIAGAGGLGDVVIDGGVIAGVEAAGSGVGEVIDCSGLMLFPGFVDIHIHGAVGYDVNEADETGLRRTAAFLATSGVTAWMPTLVPDSDENYRRIIDAIDEVMGEQADLPIAQIVGVHYEGVFANEKMCGALRPEYFKKFTGHATTPSADHPADEASAPLLKPGGELDPSTPPFEGGELSELPRLKKGVHMTTLAPEVDGGIELIEALLQQGWIASIGHTRADIETLDRAFAAGARHVTHFFNAMTGIHHRDTGVAGWALTNDGVTFDIIADGIHVNPKMLKFACRHKGADKTLLISDSVAPTGLGDGEYKLWGETISVKNGRTRNERGSIAGSVITMHDAVRRMREIGFDDVEISKMASQNPARLLGLEATYGSIEVGKRADLVGLDSAGNIKMVMIGGKLVDLS